jgi:hypothetical protein
MPPVMGSVTAPGAVPAREKHESGDGRLAVLKVAVEDVDGDAPTGTKGVQTGCV